MRAWSYIALERSGRTVSGSMEAADEASVAQRLRRAGSVPLGITAVRRGPFVGGRGDVLSRRELAYLLRELATMLGAGQDLDRALRFVVESATAPRARRVLGALRDSVRDGSPLAAAMAEHPRSFPRLAIGLVRAGEAGGTLAATLERLAVLMERQQALTATIQSAMIYPTLLLLAAIGAVVLLLTQVLPQFVPLFEQSGASLPASTRFLIDAGDAIGNDGPAALVGLAALVLAARLVLRRPAARLAFDRFKLRLPVLGGVLREVLAARLCRTLGTLLQNGVALMPALAVVREVLGNTAGVAALDRAAEAAKGGGGLSGPLGQTGVFPPRTVHLLRLGEDTAQLGPIALRAAEIHEEATRTITQRAVALLTPAITIAMGAVIAGIVSSLLLAMLSLNDLAQ
jgi:general secretion pathway protein F